MIRVDVIQTGRWCSAKMRCFPRKKSQAGTSHPKKKKKKKKGKRKWKKKKRKRRIGRKRKRRNRGEGRVAVWEGVGRVWRQVGCQEAPSKRDRAEGKKNHSLFSLPASPSATSPVFPFPRPKPPPHHTHTHTHARTIAPRYLPFFPLSRPFLFLSFLPSFLPSSHSFLSFFHFRFAVMVLSTMPLARGLVSLVRVSRRVERDVSWVLSGISSAHKPRQKKCCGFSCSRGCSFSFSTATARERERGVKREGSRVEVIVDV